jgi:hypothetical protein
MVLVGMTSIGVGVSLLRVGLDLVFLPRASKGFPDGKVYIISGFC